MDVPAFFDGRPPFFGTGMFGVLIPDVGRDDDADPSSDAFLCFSRSFAATNYGTMQSINDDNHKNKEE